MFEDIERRIKNEKKEREKKPHLGAARTLLGYTLDAGHYTYEITQVGIGGGKIIIEATPKKERGQ